MSWIATPESSNIVGFEYERETQRLIVEFKSGGRYNYFDVPEVVFEGMKVAPSKGQYLAQNIKGAYRYAKT